MSHLPVMSGDDFVKVMSKVGYEWDHTEGSHMILKNSSKKRLSVPRHQELAKGLLRALIRDAGLTHEAFMKLIT
jgi:predicted RNA binding protein YcfA (HicA-like mRNA interferase family)